MAMLLSDWPVPAVVDDTSTTRVNHAANSRQGTVGLCGHWQIDRVPYGKNRLRLLHHSLPGHAIQNDVETVPIMEKFAIG